MLGAAEAADHDVVAAFADIFVEHAADADQHVVAADRIAGKAIVEIVAEDRRIGAILDPVVAFIAEHFERRRGAEDEVVAQATEGLAAFIVAQDDEVVAVAREDEIDARTRRRWRRCPCRP